MEGRALKHLLERLARALWFGRPSNRLATGAAEEHPVRSELFSVSQLEQHARTLAGWHEVLPDRGKRVDLLLPQLAANELTLRDGYALVNEAARTGTRVTPAAEWLIDNYPLIEEQIRTARRHLPRGYNLQLPRLATTAAAGTPRVYDLALELISHSHGRVDIEGLRAFISAYQTVRPLTLGELWAIPIMLRLALIDNLRCVAARIVAGRNDRERAAHWVERMLEVAAVNPTKVVLILAEMVVARPALTHAFVAELASRLQGQGPALVFPVAWLEQRLGELGHTVEQVFALVAQHQASDQVSIGNSITSLRFLGATDWRHFVESMSAVEQVLREDPAGAHATMTFATRDRYRHAVEEIARRGVLSELQVAEAAIALASAAHTAPPDPDADRACEAARRHHVGYFLVDAGRRELERLAATRRRPGAWLRRLTRRHRLLVYTGSAAALTLTITAAVATLLAWRGELAPGAFAAALVGLAIACSQLALGLVQWASILLVPPQALPRLDFSTGIPASHRTLVAVPVMLSDVESIDRMVEALEVRYLANRDPQLLLALLTDFRDAASATLPGDDELRARAVTGITALNTRYAGAGAPPIFFLLHRARQWNPSQGVWMGWERKRGKLEELNAALRGLAAGFDTVIGDLAELRRVQYVIALDADTDLPREAAQQLAGTLAHPLNRPCYDRALGRITHGYSILQPRVANTMASVRCSRFSRLFAGIPGIDPYTLAVSDVYQDVFQEGSFVGKGIYDVDAVRRALHGRLPENRVLSHDLLEGGYARAGLVSDVTLFEDFPAAHGADVSRRVRWMRGDWQILAWLRRRVPAGDGGAEPDRPPAARSRRVINPLSWLSQWKLFDNLRRSLVPIALLAVLAIGWLRSGDALVATVTALAILAMPGVLAAGAGLLRRSDEISRRQHARDIGHGLGLLLLREGFLLATLPYEAMLALTAITRSLGRLVTRRGLLEWRTAADAQRGARTSLLGAYATMWSAPMAAAGGALALSLAQPLALPFAAPVLALWALAPAISTWISRPVHVHLHHLAPSELTFLRAAARRTWRFFETFVTEQDHHLPPDNFQDDPPQGIAHRTSPTNIGIALTANLGAYDLGYLTVPQLLDRTALAMGAMDELPRYRGHFYNWYDTLTLEPLHPRYVSTVDSGNLVGHLVILAAGLEELAHQQVARAELFSGMADTLGIFVAVAPAGWRNAAETREVLERVRHELATPPANLRSSLSGRLAALQRVAGAVDELEASLALHRAPTEVANAVANEVANAVANEVADAVANAEPSWWLRALRGQAQHALDELHELAPWAALPSPPHPAPGWSEELTRRLTALTGAPTLVELAELAHSLPPMIDRELAAGTAGPSATTWLDELRAAVLLGAERIAGRLEQARTLSTHCAHYDCDYEFLYDRERALLAIGYNVADYRLDASFYDLLASEARLASFLAISQGKLPQEHWFRLGRLLTTTSGKPALLSWSGSMFEYLMPLLIMPTYHGTILDETYRSVVARQIEYGRERGVPWGISESGYNKTDTHLNYQYRAFGVPGLGFKRGLADDLVVAPYASALALMVDPHAATANLRRLASAGALDRYGFFEAIDYTPTRLPHGKTSVTVSSYMAHHQGMSLLALVYVLRDRPMQRRFETQAAFRASELLLQERVARTPAIFPHLGEAAVVGEPIEVDALRVFTTPNTPTPEVHLLSNGTYHVAVSNSGGGYSRWRDLAVTRWHEDPTRDCWGNFGYLRDVTSKAFWSVAFQPTLVRAASYQAIYSQGRAEFRRRDGERDAEIDTHVEISISPEDDVELRRVCLTNLGRSERTLELTSYAEVVLAPEAADRAHPAFSNLFVQTELLRARQAILCTRRPRSGGERPPFLFHLMTVSGTQVRSTSYETGRTEFVGRCRAVADPIAMHRDALTDSEGAVLDPVIAIRNTVRIGAHETARFHLVTGVAETREHALAMIEKYSDRHAADRVFELSWTQSQVLLRRLDVTEADTQLYERLANSVLYASSALRAPRSILARNKSGQSALWAYGISGDLPIALLRIADRENLGLVRQLVKAHAFWRLKGLTVDLVIWNEHPAGYRQVLQDEILAVIGTLSEASLLDRPGGIFVRRSDQLSEEDQVLLQAVARVVISDSNGSLAEQVNRRGLVELPPPLLTMPTRPLLATPTATVAAAQPGDRLGFNGLGGFSPDGREYVITTGPETRTPAPWINVLANPWFGSVISESGSAYTWCENAHGYRLTPWNNDAVSDSGGEAFYLRDEEDGRFWSPTPLPARSALPYTSRHGFGYSIFEHAERGITSELCTFVAVDAPVKFIVVKLRNRSGRARRLSLTGSFELVLGASRAANLLHVVTEVDRASSALLARNAYAAELANRVAFLDCSETVRTFTGDRLEVIGRNGTPARPEAMKRVRLSGRVGAGLDPCMAMQVELELADGQERMVAFTFGSGRDLADARTLVQRFRGTASAQLALDGVHTYWRETLDVVTVKTPDAALDVLANGWLLYQTLACRIWGRSGFYQSGGAFGFRDQLQDAMALVHAEPAVLRAQLVRAAGRQFGEGDVQHWWHPPLGRGVRTRMSDDFLWLPYATCRYVDALGDTGVLTERIPFLEGRTVKAEEDSYYDLPGRSEESAPLYQHCVRAIRRGLRFGERGLPLMGSGDWNDGMNLVGDLGKGESVWLGFFLYDVLVRFARLATRHADPDFAQECVVAAAELARNLEAHGWDGQWYRRAYFDSGEPLGSASNQECQIDSLPQSWATLTGAGDPERARLALEAVDRRLVRRDLGVIQLFDPPFDKAESNPGYIKGYVPGVRENGGQYTHAAVWVVMAFAAAGDAERAWELFGLINPVHHGDSVASIATYKVEPYVVAADVYTNPQHAGRGGWTWYTGSAAWMYRLIVESLLGLHLEVDRLRLTPLLPASWPGFELRYRHRATTYHFKVRRAGDGREVSRVTLDGVVQPEPTIPLVDDRLPHDVEIQVGAKPTPPVSDLA